jgi:hypothetical protein
MNFWDLVFPAGAEEYSKIVGRVFAGRYQASNGIPKISELEFKFKALLNAH